jgi:hypothetical protein
MACRLSGEDFHGHLAIMSRGKFDGLATSTNQQTVMATDRSHGGCLTFFRM